MRQMIRAEPRLPPPGFGESGGPGAAGSGPRPCSAHTEHGCVVHKTGLELAVLWLKTVATVKWSSGCADLMIHTWSPRCQSGCLGAGPRRAPQGQREQQAARAPRLAPVQLPGRRVGVQAAATPLPGWRKG